MASSAPKFKPSRLPFVDLARGLAIVMMIANHTAQHWIDDSFGPARDWITYLTHLLAPPLFLFLAGFSLPLAKAAALERGGSPAAWNRRARWRALSLLPIGYFLTLAIFPSYPYLALGPLQTIGLTALLLIPLLPLLSRPSAQVATIGAGILFYAVFALRFEDLFLFTTFRPRLTQLLFWDVPPWPFASYMLFGVVAGTRWIAGAKAGDGKNYFDGCALIGGLAVFIAAVLAALGFHRPDYHLDLHIPINPYMPFPSPLHALWTTGAVILALPLCRLLSRAPAAAQGSLLAIGRHALLIYVVHILLAERVMVQTLHWRASSWAVWALATGLLIASMVVLSRASERRATSVSAKGH